MKRRTWWIAWYSCVLVPGFVGLLILMWPAETSPDYQRLRMGMPQEEVAAILGGDAFLVLRWERKNGTIGSQMGGTEWVHFASDNDALVKRHGARLTEGQQCQLWACKDAGIMVVFSADGGLLAKEYRKKRQPSFLQRFLDLVW